ncbi:helix-turn-helix domain-containing protein [Dermabacter hominis]|uniref:helix-turn-helix domain-containing protein n=1 Tax=Dermabacter hominis TaxID=36740 RepID=UPI00242A9BA8|nr:helix-turn-helix domain-containing protein [Dermabacter hominis]
MAYSPPSTRTHYVTLQEAAAEGYGAYSTLRGWIRKGKLPAVKTGGRVKVLREDLDALAIPIGQSPTDVAIAKLVEQAPELSRDQIAKLSQVLAAAGGGQR